MALSLLLVSPGCSTITYGPTQAVLINTIPQGATASVSEGQCVTPCKLEMDKGTETILIELKGYDTVMYPLRKRTHVGTLLFGNLITLGLGVFVDFSTNAQYHIVPVEAKLRLMRTGN
jgi:hypothetical protein